VQRPAVPGEGEPIQGHLEGDLRGAGPAGERKGEYEVIVHDGARIKYKLMGFMVYF
jgi:hypothetical protein